MKGPDISLMPLVLKVHFLNCISGEGINNLRKTLYKVGVARRDKVGGANLGYLKKRGGAVQAKN